MFYLYQHCNRNWMNKIIIVSYFVQQKNHRMERVWKSSKIWYNGTQFLFCLGEEKAEERKAGKWESSANFLRWLEAA